MSDANINDESELPAQRIKSMLGNDIEEKRHPPIFCEMQEIHKKDNDELGTWKEAARWIKFEEDVEEGGDRWSKPHVATLSLHSLFELRVLLMSGSVLIDQEITTMTDLVDTAIKSMVDTKHLPNDVLIMDKVKRQLLAKHEHQTGNHKQVSVADQSTTSITSNDKKSNKGKGKFFRHIPKGSEAANILVGIMDCLEHPVVCFIKLKQAVEFKGLCEVDIPSKFVFILLGGPEFTNYYQIGRSFSTLMSDEIFHEVAYFSKSREDLLMGIDEFLDKTTVLPPGEWDPRIRIEPPETLPERKIADRLDQHPDYIPEDKPPEEHGDDPALKRTGKLFGGLFADIKRKTPFYLSDYKDCLSLQCLSSYFFLYFAVITPVITFGGLWADATGQKIAAMESILGAALSGTVYHLLCGQPLTIIGATGPILVFDTIVYKMCFSMGIPFLPFRLWIGVWTGIICIILVATDASFLVKYITRYTEESFSTLISLIFIIDGLKKIFGVDKKNTLWTEYDKNQITQDTCVCQPPIWENALPMNLTKTFGERTNNLLVNINNETWTDEKGFTSADVVGDKWKNSYHKNQAPYLYYDQSNTESKQYICMYDNKIAKSIFYDDATGNNEILIDSVSTKYENMDLSQCRDYCGILEGDSCKYTRDVFLFSLVLSFGTFVLATKLKNFKSQRFFKTKIRAIISDFGVTAAIVIMVGLDILVGIDTPKLKVPSKFEPTLSGQRGWLIPPFGSGSEILTPTMAIAAIIPAIPATILVFLDQQITAVIVNRRENQLKKGAGYHLDLFIVASMIIITSIFGLPWFVAATVLSITHVNSLKQESESSAPGEKPKFLGVREQRVTGIFIFLTIGLSVFAVDILTNVPMPVLYGVFLYMGVSSLNGVQLFDRLGLFFMPSKHQPDYVYLRHVPINRVHLFTGIQIIGLILLWVIKKSSSVSILFPVMVAAIIFIRKSFDWLNVFTQRELSWLDDVMPEEHKKETTKNELGILKKNKEVTFHSPHSPKNPNHININDDINISKAVSHNPIIKSIPKDIHMTDEDKSLLV